MNSYDLISFSVNNFRVFSEKKRFCLSPLTILTGTNSSGKSSFTKALLLLTKSYQSNGLRHLNLMDPDLKIGGYESIINSFTNQREISFGLEIEVQDLDSFSYHPALYYVELIFNEEGLQSFEIYNKSDLLLRRSWDIELNEVVESYIKLSEEVFNQKKLMKVFIKSTKNQLKDIQGIFLNYLESTRAVHRSSRMMSIPDKADLIAEEYRTITEGLKVFGRVGKERFSELDENGEPLSGTIDIIYNVNPIIKEVLPSTLHNKLSKEILNLHLKDFVNFEYLAELDHFPLEMLKELFNRFEFIEGIRATQEIVYTKSNSSNFFNILSQITKENSSVFKKLEKWLVKEFKLIHLENGQKIEDVISIRKIEGYGYQLQIKKNGKEIGLNGLGYGVSQLLPILVRVALNPGAIFIIEEPESNLHPALQSKLADFFLSVIKNVRYLPPAKFIIETHSEYFIRKLQYLTASSSSKLKAKDTVIFYFYHPDEIPPGEDQIKQIKISEDSTLSDDFGTGFFDESDRLAISVWNMIQSKNN